MRNVTGLHHVTAICGPARENLEFYSGILGLRLVKKSVNQDDPGTYHLFFADAEGHPGTDLTFFPWEQGFPGKPGHGLASEVALAVPRGSLEWWASRLERAKVEVGGIETRFGERTLPLTDRHGMNVALVEIEGRSTHPFTAWESSPVPAERQIRGLHGARIRERNLEETTRFLSEVMGFRQAGVEGEWRRYALGEGGSGSSIDLAAAPPDARRGTWGVGSVHHLAWRVGDEAHQHEVRERIEAAGRRPTPVIDRFWFRSVYFTEPGGVLFELATDGPGFGVDEPSAHLGETLVLPPWLETQRSEIESMLPPLAAPSRAESAR